MIILLLTLFNKQTEHPEFAAGVATWMTIGTILFLIAFVLFRKYASAHSQGLKPCIVMSKEEC